MLPATHLRGNFSQTQRSCMPLTAGSDEQHALLHDTMCDMNGPHAERVVLITGAGGGVGRGYALL